MKKLTTFILIILLTNMFSCSSNQKQRIRRTKDVFDLTDHSGKFILVREKGRRKKSRDLVVRSTIYPTSGVGGKPLEKSITVSTPGMIDKLPAYRPRFSQYFVWFDDAEDKYFTKMKVNIKTKSLDIQMKSPEKKWNGKRSVPFPRDGKIFCFFGQLIECVRRTGFLYKAKEKKAGEMNFYIIWDGYPYIQEQLLAIPNRVFERVTLSYEKESSGGLTQFALKVAGQSIFYFVDKKFNLAKKFWVTQGISITKRAKVD